jgi:hypothetical protein
MCKEMPVIPVNKVVDPKRIIGKNGRPRRRRGTRVADQKNISVSIFTPGRQNLFRRKTKV